MNWNAISAVFLALAVITGAFGAHGLRDKLDPYSMGVWEKAVFYHFVHAIGMLVVSILPRTQNFPPGSAANVCWCLALGILVFSGSLYLLAVTGVRTLGMITPIGGVAFIAGWLLLAWYFMAQRQAL